MIDDQNQILNTTFNQLNQEFYSEFNPKYFRQKISYLVALLSNIDHLSDVYEKGIKVGKLDAKGERLNSEEEKLLTQILKSEISQAYYHSIETFFRLFIAHSYKSNCPWLEISDLNNYKKFKDTVEKISKHQFPTPKHKLEEIVTMVIFGNIGESNNVDKEKWKNNIKNTLSWIDIFSSDLLGNTDYNAYKHGLSLFSSELGVSLEGTPLKKEKAEVLKYITQQRTKSQIKYNKTYKYINWEEKVALIFIVSEMIENISNIGKKYYLRDEEPINIHMFDHVSPSKLFKNGINLTSINFELPIEKIIKQNDK